MAPRAKPADERFSRFVNKTADCWLWTGALGWGGYGGFTVARGRKVGAHRFAYELANGPIPAGLHVLHRCDTPACVRPDHLMVGTPGDNARDKVAKGRAPKAYQRRSREGALNPNRKLSEAAVGVIRAASAGGVATNVIAVVFDLSPSTVREIVKGQAWRNVA